MDESSKDIQQMKVQLDHLGKQIGQVQSAVKYQKEELDVIKIASSVQQKLIDTHGSHLDTLSKTIMPGQDKFIDKIPELKRQMESQKSSIGCQQKLIDVQNCHLETWRQTVIPELRRQSESHSGDLDELKKTISDLKIQMDSQKTEINELKSEKGSDFNLLELKSELNILKTQIVPRLEAHIDLQKTEINILKSDQLSNGMSINDHKRRLETQNIRINGMTSNSVPIGFIYVQLSGQLEPNMLWPNTVWCNISETYAGLFFRAEGGQSSLFGQIQEQMTQSLKVKDATSAYPDPKRSDWHKVFPKGDGQLIYSGGNHGKSQGLEFRYNQKEVRPRNQAVRIWQRIK